MEYAVSVESFLSSLQRHNPHQPEYLQAVREVFTSLWPLSNVIRAIANRRCWSAW